MDFTGVFGCLGMFWGLKVHILANLGVHLCRVAHRAQQDHAGITVRASFPASRNRFLRPRTQPRLEELR